MSRIMVVDDEKDFLKVIDKELSKDYEVESFDSPLNALERANDATFDLVVSDYRMPGMDGVKFLSIFKQRQPNSARIILSAFADRDELVTAINEAEIYRFILKPCNLIELKTTIAQALAYQGLQNENKRLADQVRAQQTTISKHQKALETLEKKYPGISEIKLKDGIYICEVEDGDHS